MPLLEVAYRPFLLRDQTLSVFFFCPRRRPVAFSVSTPSRLSHCESCLVWSSPSFSLFSSFLPLGSSFRLSSVGTNNRIHTSVLEWKIHFYFYVLVDIRLVFHRLLNLQHIVDARSILRFMRILYIFRFFSFQSFHVPKF